MAITSTRAPPRLQASDAQPNILPTSEAFYLFNAPQSTTLTNGLVIGLPLSDLLAPKTMPARVLPQAQPLGA